ncbi:MAG: hypothetical protein RI883_2261 [Bacteroidota bacterium]
MSKSNNFRIRFYIAMIVFCLFVSNSFAQPSSINRKKNPYSWMFGVGWNVVDDNGQAFSNLFDVKGSWNYLPYPTRISIDKYLKKGWSLEGMVAYNKYTSSKLINDTTGLSGIFVSGDFHVKYSFYRFFSPTKWFDPYLSVGLGVTYREVMSSPIAPTCNIALGANFWFSKSWGLQVQTMGKLGLVTDIYVSNTDYLQHTVGVVYRKQPKRSHSRNNKKRYGWTKETQKYKRRNS